MLLTVTPAHGWWSAGAVAAAIDVEAAELTFRGPLTDALLLAAAMLLPQMLTWVRGLRLWRVLKTAHRSGCSSTP